MLNQAKFDQALNAVKTNSPIGDATVDRLVADYQAADASQQPALLTAIEQQLKVMYTEANTPPPNSGGSSGTVMLDASGAVTTTTSLATRIVVMDAAGNITRELWKGLAGEAKDKVSASEVAFVGAFRGRILSATPPSGNSRGEIKVQVLEGEREGEIVSALISGGQADLASIAGAIENPQAMCNGICRDYKKDSYRETRINLPDGSRKTVYTKHIGQELLNVVEAVDFTYEAGSEKEAALYAAQKAEAFGVRHKTSAKIEGYGQGIRKLREQKMSQEDMLLAGAMLSGNFAAFLGSGNNQPALGDGTTDIDNQ